MRASETPGRGRRRSPTCKFSWFALARDSPVLRGPHVPRAAEESRLATS